MNAKRVNLVLIALVVLLCLGLLIGAKVAGGTLVNKSTQLINSQLKQDSLNNEQSELASAKADIKHYGPLAQIAKTIVPQDKNQAEAVREIVNIANANSINLGGITFPKSDLGSPSTPKSAANSTINLSQLTPVKGLSGVYELPITITSDPNQPNSYSQFISFLEQLEQNRRTAQVTNIQLNPNPKNPSDLTFILSINEYIKP